MNKRPIPFALATALSTALLLGGCGGTPNRGLESVHQPVVSRSDYLLDLATTPRGLAPGEGQRLAGWMNTMRLGYGDRVAIDGADTAAARDDVAAQVARFGLLLSDDTPVTPAPVAPGTLRVVVSRMRADVPGCPDWSRDLSHDTGNHTASNYGCAVNSSLAAMVANPADLIRGRENGETTDPALASRAIESYRKAAPSGAGGTAVKAESAGGSK